MRVGIHKAWHDKLDIELEVYKKILRFNGIDCIDLNSSSPDFWQQIQGIDYFIFKWGHDHNSRQRALTVLPIIEKYKKIKCFPSLATSWHYDDKVRQSLLLRECGFPAVDFFIFWEKAKALAWLRCWKEYPLVFKLKNGAGSNNVFLIKNKFHCRKMIDRMFGSGVSQDINLFTRLKTLNYSFRKLTKEYAIRIRNIILGRDTSPFWQKHKNYIYFQRFLPGNTFDTRVTTAGLRAHAFRRFVRPNDFRASGSDRWDIDPENIDKRMVKIALEISRYFGFQSMAYDFVYDVNKEPKIVEMSYLYGGAGYPDFMNGFWDENLEWHNGRFWPQFFELQDLLQKKDLKCPEMEAEGAYTHATIL